MGLSIQASTSTGSTEYTTITKSGIAQMEIDRQDLAEIEDGEHLVQLIGYSQPFQLTHPEYGTSTKLRLLFRVSAGDQAGALFSCMYGFSLGIKAKLTEVVEAILDRKITAGEEVDFDAILGSSFYAFTRSEINPKGYTNLKIIGVRPAKAKAPAKAQAKAKPEGKDDLWAEDF
jgi:hypothetical protein